jgi:hypothetical protein
MKSSRRNNLDRLRLLFVLAKLATGAVIADSAIAVPTTARKATVERRIVAMLKGLGLLKRSGS